MEKQTQWEHFKRNYLWTSIGIIIFSAVIFINIESEMKWLALPMFLIGSVVIPVGNYLSWRNRL